MMNKLAWLLVFLMAASLAAAVEFPAATGKYVNDYAHVLNGSQEAYLNRMFSFIESNTTAEIVFISLDTTAPDTPEQYRTKLFNAWHIGKKDANNGLLILYAVKEHRIEVETGYGLEGILPDSKVGRILDETYVPLRDQGDVPDGIVQASYALSQVVFDNGQQVRSNQAGNSIDFLANMLVVLGACLAVGFAVGRFKQGPGQYRIGTLEITPFHVVAVTTMVLLLYFGIRNDIPAILIIAAAAAITADAKRAETIFRQTSGRLSKKTSPADEVAQKMNLAKNHPASPQPKPWRPFTTLMPFLIAAFFFALFYFIVMFWQDFMAAFAEQLIAALAIGIFVGLAHWIRKDKKPKDGFWMGFSEGTVSGFGGGSSGGGGAGR